MTDSKPEPQEKQRADYTEGSILTSILKMGLPSMFGFLIQHIYSLVDMYWVSSLPDSEANVAGITFVGNILWVIFSFNQLVGPGSVAVISRRYGEKEFDRVEKAIKETLLLKLGFGTVFGILGLLLVEDLVYLIGARDLALEQAVAYGSVIFVGLPVMYAVYSIFTAMRGVANPNMAFGLMLGSNLLNMALDPLFIFGYWGFPELGIAGAAYASLISYTLTFAVGVVLFYSNVTNVRLRLRGKERVTFASMLKIVKIGIPAWLGDISFSGARLVVMAMVAPFGTSVVAAYGIANQITGFGIMVLVGIGLGLSSLIGHNIGAGKIDRARQTGDRATWLGVGLMTVFALMVGFGATLIMSIFFDDPETISIGVEILRIFAVAFPFFGAYIMMEMIHQGVGLNTPTMVFNIAESWVLQVVPIYFFSTMFDWPLTTIWWIMTVAGVITTIAFYIYYRRGRWLTHQV
jgi:putative MATE family efflux protein